MIRSPRRGSLLLFGVLGIFLVSCSKKLPVSDSPAKSSLEEKQALDHPEPEQPELKSPPLPEATVVETAVTETAMPLEKESSEGNAENEIILEISGSDELDLDNGTLYILRVKENDRKTPGEPQPAEEIRSETVAVLPKERESLLPSPPEEKLEPPPVEPEDEAETVTAVEPEAVVVVPIEPEPEIAAAEPVTVMEPEPEPTAAAEPEPLEEEPVITETEPELEPIVAAVPESEPVVAAEPKPAAEEPVIAEPEPVLTEGPRIILTSPVAGDYYRSSLMLEGRCVPVERFEEHKEGRVKTFSWRIPSQGEWSNPVFMESDGSFELDLMTAGLEGSQVLILESEDFGGRISRQTVSLRDGNQAPKIILESGEGERPYGALLAIKGRLEDPYRGIAGLEGFREFRYRLVPRDRNSDDITLEGKIPLERDGSFFMAVDMETRTGEQMLILEAEGRNESVRSLDVFLVPGRGDIPSFTMTGQDGRLVFNWEDVPGALEQTLYLTDDPDREPQDDPDLNFTGVKPPLVIDRSVNGRRYRGRVEILSAEGRFRSEILEAVPLAPGTLDLKAEGGFEQIRLSWKDIPGAGSFRIWRSREEDDFILLADNIEESSYIDATATFGNTYRYRIEPADVPGPLSYEVAAVSIESPSDKMTLASHYRQIIPEKIAVRGDYAFVAAGEGGFHIMDISIPQKPEGIGFLDQEGVHDVFLGDEYVYLASGDKGFQVVNIEEPQRPFTVLSRVTPDARSIAAREELIFVGDSQLGLQIFDIRNRQNPQRLSSIRDISALQIVLVGSRLYAALGEEGMVVLDISNPYSPRQVSAFRDSPVYDLLHKDSLMYLACGRDGMVILSEESADRWREISRFEGIDTRMIRLWERYAMIADGTGGMKAVDISNPYSPRYYGIFSSREIRALAMAEDYALLADVSGLKVVRTYLYGQSFIRQRWETPGRAYGALASGRQLWVADRTGGVAVYRADNPVSMNEASFLRTFPAEFAEDLLILDEHLYVADGPAGVKAFRLDSPDNNPVLDLPVGGRVRRVLPYGSRFAVVSSGEGVLFYKESRMNEKLNWEISSRFYSSDPRDALFYGSLLLVGDSRDGLVMAREFDGQFREMQRFGDYQGTRQLLLKDGVLYVLYRDGLALLDMTNPDHPRQTGFIPAPEAESMQIEGDRLYLAEGFRGISVYRLSKGEAPLKISVCSDLFAVDAAPSGDFAYVADMDGIAVVKIIIPEWK